MTSDPATPVPIDTPSPLDSTSSFDIEKPRPYALHLRLAIGPWTVHFRSPDKHDYVKPETMEALDVSVVKKTLVRTRQDLEVRQEIGTSYVVWHELGDLIDAAIPSIERRCFQAPAPPDPNNPDQNNQVDDYDGLSGQLIANNYPTLSKDLERVNSLVAITRNILTVGEEAQELASKSRFDKEVYRLVNLCVKVTARGFDGDPGSQDEEKWQAVINAFKKVLITSLQFLNNLVTRNERRKLMLWIQLFDSTSTESLVDSYQADADEPSFADVEYDDEERFQSTLLNGVSKKIFISPETRTQEQPTSSPFLWFIASTGREVKWQLMDKGKEGGAAAVGAECGRRWEAMSPSERTDWEDRYRDYVRRHVSNSIVSPEVKAAADLGPENNKPAVLPLEEKLEALTRSINDLKTEADSLVNNNPIDTKAKKFEAALGANILQRGKDDLMKRLEHYSERANPKAPQVTSPSSPVAYPTSPHSQNAEDGGLEEASEEEDSEDDDYGAAGDDGRGLLTDVPLILGPTEIEVLPMIIMSGMVPTEDGNKKSPISSKESETFKNLHTIRSYLLLAQDNGRNLLRELLIFVAAWDLREEELYFKFMVKIMEGILHNGLMPFSYYTFRESKDIISPAQAVIMKLLTNILRTRQGKENVRLAEDPVGEPQFPLQMDIDMVKYLFTEFRSNIIPQTCALIFLQGKIRNREASPEDFPLNLWDMERMYEGVYQYLEFFAILTEHEAWKKLMTDWDIISELVTLLRELDEAIPKANLTSIPQARIDSTAEQVRRSTAAAAALTYDPQVPTGSADPAPVAVECPYDTTNGGSNSEPSSNPMPPARFISDVGGFGNESPAEEPSDFEWRNLKKLAVLVLSSLVWRSRTVQDQVRAHKGIEAILNCCAHDEHNPYIREHAIMCLRFLLEENKENQDIIRQLQPQGVVPNEVLDKSGYESFMDARGQVGLRRKDKIPPKSDIPGKWDKDPRDIAELVQNMMKELPVRMQGARPESERAAVAKLDKGFEGSG